MSKRLLLPQENTGVEDSASVCVVDFIFQFKMNKHLRHSRD